MKQRIRDIAEKIRKEALDTRVSLSIRHQIDNLLENYIAFQEAYQNSYVLRKLEAKNIDIDWKSEEERDSLYIMTKESVSSCKKELQRIGAENKMQYMYLNLDDIEMETYLIAVLEAFEKYIIGEQKDNKH